MSVKVSSWVWERSRTIGNDRLVLLAIADCCNDAGYEAFPSIETLADKTRLHERTVQRCVRNIEAIGELRREGSGGRHANVYMVLMDALSFVDSRVQRRVRRPPNVGRPTMAREPRQIAGVETDEPRQIATPVCHPTPGGTATPPPAVPPPDPSLNRQGTSTAAAVESAYVRPAEAAAAVTDPPPTADGEPGNRADVDAFLAWWQLEYPTHNHGALNVPTWSTAGAVVAELLEHRSVAQLQLLALALWAEREDAWIFSSDRSVHVLKHRADYLDRRQRAAAPPRPAAAPLCDHVPPCQYSIDHQRRLRDEGIADMKKAGPHEP